MGSKRTNSEIGNTEKSKKERRVRIARDSRDREKNLAMTKRTTGYLGEGKPGRQ